MAKRINWRTTKDRKALEKNRLEGHSSEKTVFREGDASASRLDGFSKKLQNLPFGTDAWFRDLWKQNSFDKSETLTLYKDLFRLPNSGTIPFLRNAGYKYIVEFECYETSDFKAKNLRKDLGSKALNYKVFRIKPFCADSYEKVLAAIREIRESHEKESFNLTPNISVKADDDDDGGWS